MKAARLVFLWLVGLFLAPLALQADPLTDTISKEAAAYANAMKNADAESMVKLTWPKLVEIYGGKEKMVENLQSGKQELQAKGLKIDSMIAGEPGQPRVEGERIYCTLPLSIVMLTPNSRMSQNTYILAISQDKGGSWTFLDGNAIESLQIKSLIPDFPGDFKLPEIDPPKIENLPQKAP